MPNTDSASNPLIHPVILCGGGGTRLWPLSRLTRPKPFLPLIGDTTLFQATVARCTKDGTFAEPTIVAGAKHVHLIEEQLGENSGARIIVEPAARNTAPAIAIAACALPDDAIMLVCPSDHHIGDIAAFQGAARKAATLARDDWMVSFGIEPDRPETGFGYIKRADALEGGFRVERFVEKPDRARAEGFLAEGGFSWNGGIFAFRAGAFMAELARHRPDMAAGARAALSGAERNGAQILPDAASFAGLTDESVDYAVMENTDRAAVVPVAMDWSDIGNWEALRLARARDEDGNHTRGTAELVDCRNVMVQSDGPRVSAIALDNVTIVVNGDEVLVIGPGGEQKVGKLGGAQSQ